MRTAKVPKLLFHGTSALAGRLSYTVGREVTKLHQQNPQAAKDLIHTEQAKYFFPEFGPGFPDTNYERDICLTQNIAEAHSFARCKGEVLVPGYIHLTNPGSSRVTLMPQNYLHFPQAHQLLMGVTERLYKDAGRRTTHPRRNSAT